MPLIDPHLAELLICPLCHGELNAEETASQLRCHSCGRAYPVRDFPIMMPELAAEIQQNDSESQTADNQTLPES